MLMINSEVSGFTREEAIGETAIELGWISQEDKDRVKKTLKTLGHVSGMDLTCLKKNKQPTHCKYYGALITINDRQRLLSIAQDITKSILAEEKRKNSKPSFSVPRKWRPLAL